MVGDALEQALALQRAPFLRQSLSARPLPDGIAELLQVASGSVPPLDVAAERSGEPPQRVLEAVRFYLQEVLFFPAANAYRILGVAPGAPEQQIKAHYRLLLRWLHPDREDGDGMSVHAIRVNQAWNELRSEARRKDYDARLSEVGHAVAMQGRMSDPPRVVIADWHAEPAARWSLARVLPLVVLVGGCLLLGGMAIRQMRLEPPTWEQPSPKDAVGDVRQSARAGATDEEVPATVKPIGDPAGEVPRQASSTPLRVPAAALAPVMNGSAQADVPMRAAVSTSVQSLPLPLEMPATPKPIASLPPGAVALNVAEAAQKPVSPAQVVERTEDRSPKSTVILSIPRVLVAPKVDIADAESISKESPHSPIEDNSSPQADFARVAAAQHRAQQVAGYLGADAARTPPVWNDLQTQAQAERIHTLLRVRNTAGGGHLGGFALDGPQWRIGADTAELDSRYRLTDRRTTTEVGRVRMTMVWRENRWLVSRITLSPAAP